MSKKRNLSLTKEPAQGIEGVEIFNDQNSLRRRTRKGKGRKGFCRFIEIEEGGSKATVGKQTASALIVEKFLILPDLKTALIAGDGCGKQVFVLMQKGTQGQDVLALARIDGKMFAIIVKADSGMEIIGKLPQKPGIIAHLLGLKIGTWQRGLFAVGRCGLDGLKRPFGTEVFNIGILTCIRGLEKACLVKNGIKRTFFHMYSSVFRQMAVLCQLSKSNAKNQAKRHTQGFASACSATCFAYSSLALARASWNSTLA